MATQDFSKLFYRTSNCMTSDIISDFVPVNRVLGSDVSTGMGVVFTAMGSRFDLEYVAKEAFMATDSYESDTRSIDDTPVTEVMRYVRSEIIAADQVPVQYKNLVQKIMKKESVFASSSYANGAEDADILFLISPSDKNAESTANKFTQFAKKVDKTVYCSNEHGDLGYLLLQLGQIKLANEVKDAISESIVKYNEIITDDAYVLDALLIQFPEFANKIKMIDQFILEHKNVLGSIGEKIVVHESGIIQRLYPLRVVDYNELFKNSEVILPARSGFDVSDSGLAGGFGLFEPENFVRLASRRMKDLTEPKHDVIVASCSSETTGLNCAELENVVTLLDYISK